MLLDRRGLGLLIWEPVLNLRDCVVKAFGVRLDQFKKLDVDGQRSEDQAVRNTYTLVHQLDDAAKYLLRGGVGV
jgi:hypothetical protein